MKALAFAILFLSTLTASGHVGSPDIFFEDSSGLHPVRVIVRPPATLPGAAQIDVRVGGAATLVTLQAAPWAARDDALVPPITATPVSGEAGLFNALLWIPTAGSYRLQVGIESARGRSQVSVPLNAAALQAPALPPALGVLLAGFGASLTLGAIWIAGAVARDGSLPLDALPSREDERRRRVVCFFAALILVGALFGVARRWQTMDREFRNNALSHPLPVEASIRNAGPLRLLHLARPPENGALGWDALLADHGKLMHLFLLREPGFEVFAHLHPVRRNGETFQSVLPPLPAGTYQLYAEITQENGLSQTLTARLSLPAPSGPDLPPMADWKAVNEVWCRSPGVPLSDAGEPFALDPDDSWHIGAPLAPAADSRRRLSPLPGGGQIVFENAGELFANHPTSLRFTVITAEGRRATLQPYMGMLGHAVVRRADGAVFTHLHPAGTVSMAATDLLASRDRTGREPAAVPFVGGDEVTFPYAFPRPGSYRLWVQVRLDGRVRTSVFDVQVAPPP